MQIFQYSYYVSAGPAQPNTADGGRGFKSTPRQTPIAAGGYRAKQLCELADRNEQRYKIEADDRAIHIFQAFA
jgi:hypothetical protein